MGNLPSTFWAWLAGFVDGDGCIGVYRMMGYLNVRLTIAQKDPTMLYEIRDALGTGSVARRGKTKTKGVMHALVFGSAASREVIRQMLPYLRGKKEDAKAALEWKHIPKYERKNSATKHPKYDEVMSRYRAGESAQALSQETGVKDATILYWVRTAGISRSFQEAQRLRRKREAKLA